MTRTLILTRHAKSAWDDPTLDDFDRTLNGRGRKSAKAIGNWLVQMGVLPDLVLVSGARRTVETWSRMAPAFPPTATMQSVPALYHGSADTILNVLKTQSSATVMLIAHNPGIAEFAERALSTPVAHPKFHQYPTGATTLMSFDTDVWSAVSWGSGIAQDFTVPRDLLET